MDNGTTWRTVVRWNRRRVLEAGAGLAGLATVGTRGVRAQGTPESGTSPAAGAGEWTYTDDAGKTVTLPKRPERIVADLNAATALWDFGIRPVAVSGWTVTNEASWGNVDRATPVINASEAAPEPDLEELLNVGAELFVTIHYPEDPAPYMWSFQEESSVEQAEQIMPVVGVSVSGRADENLESFRRLAGLLGADLEAPELVAAEETYEATKSEFETVAAGKADITSLFIAIAADAIYVANPPDWADLTFYASLGQSILEPDIEEGTWWETLSLEQAGLYQPDVLYASNRGDIYTLDDLRAHPTLGTLAAVQTGQVGEWTQDFIQSYQGLTAGMEQILAALRDAEKIV